MSIPPVLPPTQYSYQVSQTSQDAFEEFCVQNNLITPTLNAMPEKDCFQKSVKLIAHRGFSSTCPENTIPAFEEAARQGYKNVECDISWTSDGVPVLLHDPIINRTAASPSGLPLLIPRYCSDMTYKELLKYDFGIKKGDQFKGTKIPTFSEFLQCCKDNDLSPYIELKNNKCVNPDRIRMLVGLVEEYGLSDKVTWISFNSDYLKIISECAPSSRIGFLYSKTPDKKTLAVLDSLKTDRNEVFLDAKASNLTKNSVKLIKEHGYAVEAWTVSNMKYYDKVVNMGCSAVTTNNLTENEVSEYIDTFTK